MEYKLVLDEKDLSIIDKALVNLPYREVINIINKINNQIKALSDSEKETEKDV